MTRQRHHLFTEAEYWYLEEGSTNRHEYFEGEVLALPVNSPSHNDIVGNIASSLKSQLRGYPCRVRAVDQRIKVEATSLQTYPDVVVVCPPFRFDPNNQITLLDATVIIEVLSDSTRQYDQTEKFRNYRELPSLLVEPDQLSIEHRTRLENGEWTTKTFTEKDEVINLAAIACTLTVGTVYEEVDLG